MNIEIKTGTYNRNGESVPFEFSTSLSASNKLNFVNSVVKVVVDDDDYNYVIENMIFDFYIVNYFTNIDVSEITESPNNIDMIEDFLNETDIVNIIKMNAVPGIINELEKAVSLNIEYKTGIHINPISSSLSSLLDTIEQKVDSIDFEEMMGIAGSIASISDELTADKLLDAYAKTDIFKKNWENAESDKEVVNVVKGGKEAYTSPLLSPTV
nr:MAG TPA: hypothetical protein [Caudoviricetes sp.]